MYADGLRVILFDIKLLIHYTFQVLDLGFNLLRALPKDAFSGNLNLIPFDEI